MCVQTPPDPDSAFQEVVRLNQRNWVVTSKLGGHLKTPPIGSPRTAATWDLKSDLLATQGKSGGGGRCGGGSPRRDCIAEEDGAEEERSLPDNFVRERLCRRESWIRETLAAMRREEEETTKKFAQSG